MGGIAKQNGMIPKCIGGVSDHVHLLVTLPTTLAIAKAVQLIKAGSSAWIHQTFPNLRNYAWQTGLGITIGAVKTHVTLADFLRGDATHRGLKRTQDAL